MCVYICVCARVCVCVDVRVCVCVRVMCVGVCETITDRSFRTFRMIQVSLATKQCSSATTRLTYAKTVNE